MENTIIGAFLRADAFMWHCGKVQAPQARQDSAIMTRDTFLTILSDRKIVEAK